MLEAPRKYSTLSKSIYGLKQAGRQWHKKLMSILYELGFKRLESDRSIFIFVKDDVKIILPVYIDDMTLASKSGASIDKVVVTEAGKAQ